MHNVVIHSNTIIVNPVCVYCASVFMSCVYLMYDWRVLEHWKQSILAIYIILQIANNYYTSSTFEH